RRAPLARTGCTLVRRAVPAEAGLAPPHLPDDGRTGSHAPGPLTPSRAGGGQGAPDGARAGREPACADGRAVTPAVGVPTAIDYRAEARAIVTRQAHCVHDGAPCGSRSSRPGRRRTPTSFAGAA